MKLMRLSPLAQRLRRVARAHAAGETSIETYRQARRQLLAELGPVPARKVDDTQRRGELADLPKRSGSSAAKLSKSGSSTQSAQRRRGRIRYRWLIGALGAALTLLWALLRT